ncbi:exocyst complex component 7, partial [Tremellales sp. Uapishka_1]
MDEEADLALLDQHLLKTNLLSQRMTGILAQLDSRLSRLDKTIAPLGIQPLTRKAHNIDATLALLNPQSSSSLHPRPPNQTQRSNPPPSLASARDQLPTAVPQRGYSIDPLTPIPSRPESAAGTPADETVILTRGPDIMALGEYATALDGVIADLERMWKGFTEGRGGAREAGVKDLSKLVEIGFGGMVQLFLNISKEGTAKTLDVEHTITNGKTGTPTPPNYFSPLNTLLPLTARMLKLLHPSVPTPKTESLITPMFDKMVSEFSVSEGDWLRRGLDAMVAHVDEIDEGGIWEDGRGSEKVEGLLGLWEGMMVLVEVSFWDMYPSRSNANGLQAETLLITTLFPNHPPGSFLPQSLAQPLASLSNTLSPTINIIKRKLTQHIFLALDLYQSLIRFQPRWEQSISKCLAMANTPSGPESKLLHTALHQPISTVRGLVMRSFPELLVDIRSPPTTGNNANPSTSISDTTYSTLTYLEALPMYEKTVEGLLGTSHSERSWLMGAKEPPSSVKSASSEGGLVSLYVADILGTLIIHVDNKSKGMRRPIGQAFALNNLSHVRNTTSSLDSDLIGPGAEDMLNKAFRDAKNQYLSEWQALTTLLSPGNVSTPRFGVSVGGHSERQALKESAVAFLNRFTELEIICKQYPLARSDPDMRDRVGREVEDLVVGAWQAFNSRCAGKALEKYLTTSSEDLRRRLQGIFR